MNKFPEDIVILEIKLILSKGLQINVIENFKILEYGKYSKRKGDIKWGWVGWAVRPTIPYLIPPPGDVTSWPAL